MSEELCYCLVGLHEECNNPQPHEIEGFVTCCCWSVEEITPVAGAVILGGYKENSAVGDVLSTGRKRAAALYPITDGMTCEWSGLRYAGGGVHPIIGCHGTKIIAAKGHGAATGHIHHGPDKNTLNNERENIHRICTTCHNRWHTLNDPYYGERPEGGVPFLPVGVEVKAHDPVTKAEIMQQFKWETWWQTDKHTREDITDADFG